MAFRYARARNRRFSADNRNRPPPEPAVRPHVAPGSTTPDHRHGHLALQHIQRQRTGRVARRHDQLRLELEQKNRPSPARIARTVGRDLVPYGIRAVSPKYTRSSCGRSCRKCRTTDSPPRPESEDCDRLGTHRSQHTVDGPSPASAGDPWLEKNAVRRRILAPRPQDASLAPAHLLR